MNKTKCPTLSRRTRVQYNPTPSQYSLKSIRSTNIQMISSHKQSQITNHHLHINTLSLLTTSRRTMALSPHRRNLPKSKSSQSTTTATTTSTPSKPNLKSTQTFQQDYVSAFQNELDQLNSSTNPMPLSADAQQNQIDPNTPLSMHDISQIYGSKAKLILPDIPLNGQQAYWASTTDPNNPFSFPILNLTTLLSSTDLSVSIDPKDSDVPAEKVFEDYKLMMATTINQSKPAHNESHNNSGKNSKYDLNTNYTQDQLEKSLYSIANPQLQNPLNHLAISQQTPTRQGQDDHSAQMATSRVQFGQTIVITTPVRKSQLPGIEQVFKITPIHESEPSKSTNIIPTDPNPYVSNPLNNMICLSKASQSNKRFDIFLSRSIQNSPPPPLNLELSSSLQVFRNHHEPQQQQQDELTNKTALIFTSNISHQSLTKTISRINAQTLNLTETLSKQNKTYQPPFQEHVCIERNYLIELERDPLLIKFPFVSHDINKQDPITHILAFPIQASTVTYSVDDPLEEPSNEVNYRLSEAEFLIQCCLMGQNFPAPIDPRFSVLIEQDRNSELTLEESQKIRETIGRSVVAMYGHGSGIAAEKWSLKRPMIKEELYQRPLSTSSTTSATDKLQLNYELEVSYAHKDFYQTLYSFAQLPSESEIQRNLHSLRQQVLSMSGHDTTLLDQITQENDHVFRDILPHSSLSTGAHTDNNLDLSTLSHEEIEIELANRLKQVEQRQYLFQTQFEDQLRMESIQRSRITNSLHSESNAVNGQANIVSK